MTKFKPVFRAIGLLAALTLASSVGLSVAWADVESKDPIKITYGDWTPEQLNTEIMGRILEKLATTSKTCRRSIWLRFLPSNLATSTLQWRFGSQPG